MIRILFLAFSLLCVLGGAAQLKKNNDVDKVIWVVGDSPILLSEVEEQRISAEISKMPSLSQSKIAEQIAIQRLFLHQAELDSVNVEDEQINVMVEEALNERLQIYGSHENLEKAVGRSLAQIREIYKEQIKSSRLMEAVQEKLTEKIKVTPAEVREYFSTVSTDSLPLVPTQVEVQLLTAVPQVSLEEKKRIEERLLEFTRRVNEGETEFSRLARMYSQDGSAREGGALGMSGRNQWVPEFANVAFSLTDPKKVSKIVRTDFGFHIIQLIEKRGDKVNVRHILLKPEIETAEYERCLARLDSIADEIKANKFTFEAAVRAISDDKNTRNNDGLLGVIDPSTRKLTTLIETDKLPKGVAPVVADMQPGDISKSFRMLDESTGQEITAIAKLKNRRAAHRANATEDFQLLQKILLAQRRADFLKKWVAEKIKNTYTRIAPEWRNEHFEYEGWVK